MDEEVKDEVVTIFKRREGELRLVGGLSSLESAWRQPRVSRVDWTTSGATRPPGWKSARAWWTASGEIQTLEIWLSKMPVITFYG